jgi:hypothetical protein
MKSDWFYTCLNCGNVDQASRIVDIKKHVESIDLELAEINLKINHLSDNSIALIKQVKKITKLLMDERSHEHAND